MSNTFDAIPQDDRIANAIQKLKSELRVVGQNSIPLAEANGRVLAQDILAFRDSPSIDVSAMDGYAVRIDDLNGLALPVIGTATAGSTPIDLHPQSAVRVFTGGPVPAQAQCVVRREDCNESETYVSVCLAADKAFPGMNIRRQGENVRTGELAVPRGTLLSANRFAGACTFLESDPVSVFQKVRISIINTGDELLPMGAPIQPWQIRDSNGPFLQSILTKHEWVDISRSQVADDPKAIETLIRERLPLSDVLLLTGGVSMGDTDYVPDAIQDCGGKVVFHRIPIRPGKPILGAYGPTGQLILGLPGNPLSVAVTFRRFALELIQHVGGFANSVPACKAILSADDTKQIPLTWYRLVKLEPNGQLSLVPTLGSGDIASLVQADGFVEIPPNTLSSGIWPFYAW
jgi:molybdopterin molybdotransferase